jgi:hypothetical protein
MALHFSNHRAYAFITHVGVFCIHRAGRKERKLKLWADVGDAENADDAGDKKETPLYRVVDKAALQMAVISPRRRRREEITNRKGGEEGRPVCKQKNHRGRLWFYQRAIGQRLTGLSPSVPTKLADGLGLKDTPLAGRDTPQSLVPPLSPRSERLGRQLFNFSN